MAQMIPLALLAWCLLCAGLYHVITSVLLDYAERRFALRAGIPSEMLEASGPIWTMLNLVMEGLFVVVIPSIAYGFFYLVVPLSGIRAGLGAALFAFVLGAAPAIMGLSVKIKLPLPFLLFSLLSLLLKLGGSLVIISYLYSL